MRAGTPGCWPAARSAGGAPPRSTGRRSRVGKTERRFASRTRNSRYTDLVGLKNVTITLDEDVARWMRIRAAERDTSVSRLVGELLREKMIEDRSYETAMREYLARPARKLKEAGTPYPTRADLYG